MRFRLSLMIPVLVALGVLSLGVGAVIAQGEGPPERARRIQSQIDAYKTDLAKDGKYACCTKMPCDMCATHMGGCPCGGNVAVGKPVCPQCKGMWHAGMGAIAGKKAEDIQVMKPMEAPE